MLGVLAEQVVTDGPWGVLIAGIIIVPGTTAAVISALKAGKAKKNTQPNGGTSPHDQVIKGQEYAIGLIHGIGEEMRHNFRDVSLRADDAVHVAALAGAAVKQSDVQTAEIKRLLENHLKNSEEYGAAFVKAGEQVIAQLGSLTTLAEENKSRIDALEHNAQGLP